MFTLHITLHDELHALHVNAFMHLNHFIFGRELLTMNSN